MQDDWFQKQILACLERFVTFLHTEISRHQAAVLIFSDMETGRTATPSPDRPFVPFRTDLTVYSVSSESVMPVKKGAQISSKQESASLDPVAFIDPNGNYIAEKACHVLRNTGKVAMDLATVKDATIEPNLVRFYESVFAPSLRLCLG
jgi:hypothetical protein